MAADRGGIKAPLLAICIENCKLDSLQKIPSIKTAPDSIENIN